MDVIVHLCCATKMSAHSDRITGLGNTFLTNKFVGAGPERANYVPKSLNVRTTQLRCAVPGILFALRWGRQGSFALGGAMTGSSAGGARQR